MKTEAKGVKKKKMEKYKHEWSQLIMRKLQEIFIQYIIYIDE